MENPPQDPIHQTKEKILMSALALFCEKGYSKTTLNDISNSLNLSKGAIYWHFKNKEELFYSLIEWFVSEMERVAPLNPELVKTPDDLKKLLIGFCNTFLMHKELQKGYCILLSRSEWMNDLTKTSSYIEKMFSDYIMGVSKIFKGLQAKGMIKPEINPELTVKALLSAMDGIFINSIFLDDFSDTGLQIENLLNLMFKAIDTKTQWAV